MTKDELKDRVQELVLQSLNTERIDALCESLLRSGAVALERETTPYRLPKLIVCALATRLYDDYMPRDDDRRSMKEIRTFSQYL